MPDLADRARTLLDLHTAPEILVLANVWDVVSARVVAGTDGVRALATASHSIAATFGYEDGENIPLDLHLDMVGRIVAAVDLPVTMDIEAGYGDAGRDRPPGDRGRRRRRQPRGRDEAAGRRGRRGRGRAGRRPRRRDRLRAQRAHRRRSSGPAPTPTAPRCSPRRSAAGAPTSRRVRRSSSSPAWSPREEIAVLVEAFGPRQAQRDRDPRPVAARSGSWRSSASHACPPAPSPSGSRSPRCRTPPPRSSPAASCRRERDP